MGAPYVAGAAFQGFTALANQGVVRGVAQATVNGGSLARGVLRAASTAVTYRNPAHVVAGAAFCRGVQGAAKDSSESIFGQMPALAVAGLGLSVFSAGRTRSSLCPEGRGLVYHVKVAAADFMHDPKLFLINSGPRCVSDLTWSIVNLTASSYVRNHVGAVLEVDPKSPGAVLLSTPITNGFAVAFSYFPYATNLHFQNAMVANPGATPNIVKVGKELLGDMAKNPAKHIKKAAGGVIPTMLPALAIAALTAYKEHVEDDDAKVLSSSSAPTDSGPVAAVLPSRKSASEVRDSICSFMNSYGKPATSHRQPGLACAVKNVASALPFASAASAAKFDAPTDLSFKGSCHVDLDVEGCI